ncbi:MAG TPA: TIGR03435 family protein [Bryobacteraceae bacterium]|nr:TIGR03435 family protein [Bryobacteraceae bacterium]
MHSIRWSILAFSVPMAVFGQAQERPQFEVASVKPAGQIVAGPEVRIGIRIDGAQFSCTSYSLRDYLRYAYQVKPFQVLGPDWITQERYAVTARIPEGASREQVPAMLQALLEERFKVKLHHDKKEFPIYALVVGKSGIKMKELEIPASEPVPSSVNVNVAGGPNGVNVDLGGGAYFGFANNKLEGKKLPMARLADMLALFADRPVVDLTGLKGRYEFAVPLAEEDYRAMLIRSAVNNGVSLPPQVLQYMSGDSLYSAVELLGLKLEPRKGPLDVIVVDSAEKTPTEN